MKKVFADTFYWVSLTNPHDGDHSKALEFDVSEDRPDIVTTKRSLQSS